MSKKNIKLNIEFKVVAVSENTNSFGLYQMILVSKCGKAFKSHASMYNVKPQNSIISGDVVLNWQTEKIISCTFRGHEMTTQIEAPDQETINKIWQ